jgi:hypothetical protein
MICKPVISYAAEQILPLNENLNKSIVSKKLTKTSYRNWNDKDEFVSYVDSLYVPPTSNCYVYIRCQCGAEYDYPSKVGVPSENLICGCGRKVIEYGS